MKVRCIDWLEEIEFRYCQIGDLSTPIFYYPHPINRTHVELRLYLRVGVINVANIVAKVFGGGFRQEPGIMDVAYIINGKCQQLHILLRSVIKKLREATDQQIRASKHQ